MPSVYGGRCWGCWGTLGYSMDATAGASLVSGKAENLGGNQVSYFLFVFWGTGGIERRALYVLGRGSSSELQRQSQGRFVIGLQKGNWGSQSRSVVIGTMLRGHKKGIGGVLGPPPGAHISGSQPSGFRGCRFPGRLQSTQWLGVWGESWEDMGDPGSDSHVP
jgi:hypothetical protein